LGLGPAHLLAAVVALVVVTFAALAVGNGALASLAPAPPRAAAVPSSAGDTATVTVVAGDTLWSIARRLQPTGEVRPLVDQLVALNGSAPLQPGAEVLVPT
jgi:nucleoid-associated protein YgaU